MLRILALCVAVALVAPAQAQTNKAFTADLAGQEVTLLMPNTPAWNCEYVRTFPAVPGEVIARLTTVTPLPGWTVTISDGHHRAKRVPTDEDEEGASRTSFPLSSLFRITAAFGPKDTDVLAIEIGAFGHGGVAEGIYSHVETEQARALVRRVAKHWISEHGDREPWVSAITRIERFGASKVYQAEHAATAWNVRRRIGSRVYGFAMWQDTYLIHITGDARVLVEHTPEVERLLSTLLFKRR